MIHTDFKQGPVCDPVLGTIHWNPEGSSVGKRLNKGVTLLFLILDRVSPGSSDWPGTHYTDQAGFRLTEICLSLSGTKTVEGCHFNSQLRTTLHHSKEVKIAEACKQLVISHS